MARHQSTGADGHSERVKRPATVVPGANEASSTSSRPVVAEAGGPGRELDTPDGRQFGEARRGEWGDDAHG